MKPKVEQGKPSKRARRQQLKAKIQALIFIVVLFGGAVYSIRFIITNWR